MAIIAGIQVRTDTATKLVVSGQPAFNKRAHHYRLEQDITLYKEAAMLFRRMIAPLVCILLGAVLLIPSCANDAAQQQARDYLVKGYGYFTQSQWDQAIAEYSRAIEMDPKLAAAYNYRGSAYGEKGDYDKAIADLNMAIELAPALAENYRNRGIAFGKKGDYDKAIADFTTGIGLDPKDARAYYNRGAAYDKKGEKTKADADFAKAKELGWQ